MDLPLILGTLERHLPNWQAFYLFGSHAHGTDRPDSDLDLAVLCDGPPLDPVRMWEIAQIVAEVARCDVDLIDLKSASTVLQWQIVVHGERLKARQPLTGDFEAKVVQQKFELDALRARQLKDIRENGSVYG
ncbi:type VII toxin-antitoxin system MntA family adenylyltransferase antitoxin [Pseudomonas sp. KNUC1026]|uniref:type VII toxin-antitoxin system MntA family adenylyltransferase antitoxin n=1 Tax=Pseudomonas sp. KNUC1026 TaxID=2893890 RepID=UPI001F3F16A3|nr:nucleotidyltransferase domain-containing protein [Pseudomonas sp. KNUC1026]UFH51465.1 nucleotidyltransferase domain-containing protein [Pseudomonas sp. KNUC1026]